QTEGSRLPLFLVHPVAGVVFPYYDLALRLGAEQPVYGLQSVGIAGEAEPLTQVEAMAETYLEAIRQIQPEGPYQLAGWSFGGLIALEMAQQLHQARQEVGLLAIIDTPLTLSPLGASKVFLTTVLPHLWPYVSDYLAQQSGRSQSKSRLNFKSPEVQRLMRVLRANLQAGRRYRPQRYPGQITLFKTAISHRSVTWGWDDIASSGVEIDSIPGHHMNVLRSPQVETLAEKLRHRLERIPVRETTPFTPEASSVTEAVQVTDNASQTFTPEASPVTPPSLDNEEALAVSASNLAAEPLSTQLMSPDLVEEPLPTQHLPSNLTAEPLPTRQPPPSGAGFVVSSQKAEPSPSPQPHLSASATTNGVSPASRQKPLTGVEYLHSLQDGREVWIYGERVPDVTSHPAFRNQCRMIARLYDALHDPARQALLTCETDTGSGGYTHPFFRASRTVEEQAAARNALAAWHRIGYGWIGRGPDHMAGLLGMLGPNADFYGSYQDNARRWYQFFQETMPYVNHAIVNPPIDRHRPPDQVDDVYIHVVKETEAGLIVSGAKNVTTNSALTNYTFVGQDGGVHVKTKPFAITFLLAMNTPGLKIVCRPSYEMTASIMGTPFDYPLSSRLDENDAILIFDEVLVPWDNILVYGDLEKQNQHVARTGFLARSGLQGCTRLAVKLDLLTGLLLKAVEATGVEKFRGVQVNVGEVITWRHLFWSLSDAMAQTGVPHNGAIIPKMEHMMAHRMLMGVAYPRIKEIISQLVASGLIFQPSSALDFKTPELRPYLDKYVRGSTGDSVQRIKLMKTLWDAIGTEFAGRHELYERNNMGNHEAIRLHALFDSLGTGVAEEIKQFAETCMAEVDLEGWLAPDLHTPDDLGLLRQWLERRENNGKNSSS
ncbi:MAG: hypothetical protein KDJ52_29585, partial [Anaerolineae bacterium]|nr:hypothetical protein [Anaerolineae bacterium]